MLYVGTGANNFNLTPASWGTTRPAAANGTAVTPAVGSYGSYAQLFTATSYDSYGILININSNTGSAASRGTVIDIGVDEAGGTSYTARIEKLLCGGAIAYHIGGSGLWYYFPIFIRAGSTVAVRGNSTVVTAFRVGAMLMQQPTNPAMSRYGSYVEALGVSGNVGTAVTAGGASEGAWTLIGTTTRPLWQWQVGLQVSTADTAWGINMIHVDVAVGDVTNKHIIIQDMPFATSTAEQLSNTPWNVGVERDVPSGSNIYVRAQTSSTADPYTCAVYGLGG